MRRAVREVALVFWTLAAVLAVWVQPPLLAHAQDAHVISGRVVDASTGTPVSGVVVVATGANMILIGPPTRPGGYAPPRVLTAADGRFVFRGLPEGTVGMTATKNGYAEGAYGRRRPGGSSRSLVLSAAQPSADVTIRIWKNGAISGTLIDEAGEPVIGAQLRACKATFVAGIQRFEPVGQAFTDDRGAYRFSNLLPGNYIVAVSAPRPSLTVRAVEDLARTGGEYGNLVAALPGTPTAITVGDATYGIGRGSIVPPAVSNGHLMVYPPTFYPSAPTPSEAVIVTLASGEERFGIDVQIQPVAAARVAGLLVGPDGPIGGATLYLRSPGSDHGVRADDLTAMTDLAGRFVFPAVPPGAYALRGHDGTASTRSLWIDSSLIVAGDVEGLVATMRPAMSVTGRTEYQGAEPPLRLPQMTYQPVPFVLEPIDGLLNVADLSFSGNFGAAGLMTISGFAAGTYLVRVDRPPEGWMFKSATINGLDVSETPFELIHDVPDLVITFTDRLSGLAGTVLDPNGNSDIGATVIVFPANANGWRDYGSMPRRLKRGATNANGVFEIGSLPPGDYFAVAIPEDDSDDWRDPKVLDALARIATTVTILEGEHRMIELRTKEVPR